MKLSDDIVILPSEDAIRYDLAWRFKVASFIAADDATRRRSGRLGADAVIRRMILYLRQREDERRKPKDGHFARLIAWQNGPDPTRVLIEALLLAEEPLQEIADEAGATLEEVRDYEALFFNVLGPDGKVAPARLRHLSLEASAAIGARLSPAAVKSLALAGGKELVQTALGLKKQEAAENTSDLLFRLADQELLRRVMGNELNTRELLQLQGNRAALERANPEESRLKKENAELLETLRGLFKIIAPKLPEMKRPLRGVDDGEGGTQEAERNIAGVVVVDNGPAGREALGKAIDAKIASMSGSVRPSQIDPPPPPVPWPNTAKKA